MLSLYLAFLTRSSCEQMALRRILSKDSKERNKRETQKLVEHIQHIRFLKEMKMKPDQLKKVAQELGFKQVGARNYLIMYGTEGDDFYIILDG